MHHQRSISRALLGAIICVALLPASAFAMSRTDVLARGKAWVTKNVPYSQTRYAKIDGTLIPASTPYPLNSTLGYRTDCSGFVSMCLNLTNSKGQYMSLATDTLPRVLTPIAKNQLQGGDVILRPKGPDVAYGHAVLFVGWADAAHTSYWSYEESNSSSGTITRKIVYPFWSEKGFAPYRYVQMDDYFSDVESAIYGPDRYKTAAAAACITFPATATPPATAKALVVENGDLSTGNLAGVALAGAVKGPLVLTEHGSLTATAAATIKRLKPKTVYVIGPPSAISTGVAAAIGKLGPSIKRVWGSDRYALTSNAAQLAVPLARAAGRHSDTAYIVGTNSFTMGLAVSPVAARVARPVLIATRTTLPGATLTALKRTGIKKVIILGSTSEVGSGVVSALRAKGISVSRIVGTTPSVTRLRIQQHGVALRCGLSWKQVGVASLTSWAGVLPCGVAQGEAGSLLLFTTSRSLDSNTATVIKGRPAAIGKVRVFGDYFAIEQAVRAAIAKLMRATP